MEQSSKTKGEYSQHVIKQIDKTLGNILPGRTISLEFGAWIAHVSF